MAKKPIKVVDNDEVSDEIREAEKNKKKGIDPSALLESYLKETKGDHLNFEVEKTSIISTGSLMFDITVGGGLFPGVLRSSGISNGGKTSAGLLWCKNFLDGSTQENPRRGFYVKAEGRLSKNIREKSGVKFVDKTENWVDGTCFIYKGNVYENIAHAIKMFMDYNDSGVEYFFMIDSMDALITKGDVDKDFTEANKVAGSSVLTSDFLRRTSLHYSSKGHYCYLISQVRATIKKQYEKEDHRLTNATGGNALVHYSDWIFEFQPTFKKDLILDKEDKTIGHNARVLVCKSDNETNHTIITYPIKHGRVGGNSIWRSREIVDVMLAWGAITKKGSWLYIQGELKEKILAVAKDFPEQLQGIESWYDEFEREDRRAILDLCYSYIKELYL